MMILHVMELDNIWVILQTKYKLSNYIRWLENKKKEREKKRKKNYKSRASAQEG